jgi:group I intron endonuclease
MNNSNYKLYKHTNKINGKVYVGITQQEPKDRFKSGSAYRNNLHFKSAIEKYGWDNFSHEVLKTGLSESEAKDRETKTIEALESNNPLKGYNKSTGGEAPRLNEEQRQNRRNHLIALAKSRSGKHLSEQHRERISRSNTGKKYPGRGTGRILSDESKLKISMANSGKKRSPEAIEKNRLAHVGKKTKRSVRNKISESMKELRGKKVVGFNLETHELTNVFESVREAADHFNLVNPSSITNCCRGRSKSSAGYRWMYID